MPTVLHVLPHPGGGGETYVDTLEGMDDYRFERLFLAPSPKPTLGVLPAAAKAQLRSRTSDLMHIHGEAAATTMLPLLALRPSVVTLHGLHLLRRLHGRQRTVAALNLRLIVRAASATICVSEAERDDVTSTVGKRTADRAVVIHNGVPRAAPIDEDERRRARAELQLAPNATVGLFVGSLEEHKDPLIAAQAAVAVAQERSSLVLAFAGEGPLRRQLDSVAEENTALLVLGFRKDLRTVLAAADFLVLPSYREGLSYALLEAMSLGLPAVVSDAPGNPEAVGESGIIVPRGDLDGFADAFRQMLNAPSRSTLGERAAERASTVFSVQEMLRRTGELYDEVIGARGRGARSRAR